MKPTPGSPGEHEHAGETYILRHGDTLYRVTAASARDATAEALAFIDDPNVWRGEPEVWNEAYYVEAHRQPGDVVDVPDVADDIRGAVALWGPPSGGGGTPTPTTTGTSGNNSLFGTMGADHIDGRGGNDFINGLRGNDTLLGGAGNDTIHAGLSPTGFGAHENTGGRNILDGGTGNDHLFAGHSGVGLSTWTPAPGSDTFRFAPGHGHDMVYGSWGSSLGREHFGAPEKIDLSGFGSQAPTWAQVASHLTTVSALPAYGSSAPSVRLDPSDFGGGSITFWNRGASTTSTPRTSSGYARVARGRFRHGTEQREATRCPGARGTIAFMARAGTMPSSAVPETIPLREATATIGFGDKPATI